MQPNQKHCLQLALILPVISLVVSCGGTSGDINPGPVTPAPTQTTVAVTLAENIEQVSSLNLTQNTDPSNPFTLPSNLSFAITGGADRALFSLSGTNLSFNNAPDFEAPGDADSNNVYLVEITGTATVSGASSTAQQNVSITIQDVDPVTAAKNSVLNDTGIVNCGDYAFGASGNHNNDIDCVSGGATDADMDTMPATQDAHNGRDHTSSTNSSSLNKTGTGLAGFDFTKLSKDAEPLAVGTSVWSCVKDNVTGLIWEVKQDQGLHRKSDLYTWYNTTAATNGGNSGTENTAIACDSYDAANSATYCNTQAYVSRVNTAKLCGLSNWRMPTANELRSIINYSRAGLTIDQTFFSGTQAAKYWTSRPNQMTPANAISISFVTGFDDSKDTKATALAVRLVSAGE